MQTTSNTYKKKPQQTNGSKDKFLGIGKLPAKAIDLEKAVLGGIILEKDRLEDVVPILSSPDFFYSSAHIAIYEVMLEMCAVGNDLDLLTLTERLRNLGILEIVGGPVYLTELTMCVVSTAHIVFHSTIIKEKYLKRQMVKLGNEMITMGYNNTDVFENMDIIDRRLAEFNMELSGSEPLALNVAMPEAVQDLVRLRDLKSEFTGIPTGNKYLDELTGGWQFGNLVVIGARPGTGKTMLGMMNAMAAAQYGVASGIFSLEMSVTEITKRLISSLTQTSNNKIKAPKSFADIEFNQMLNATSSVMNLPIFIDGESGLNLATLKSKIRKLVSRKGVKLVVVDYLQLMSIPGYNANSEYGVITRGLKILAKELNIVIILLSQLNRDSTKDGRIPRDYDLRDSGSIESDADIIIMLYEAIAAQKKNEETLKYAVMLNLAKQRNGAKEEALPLWPQWDKFTFNSDPLQMWDNNPQQLPQNNSNIKTNKPTAAFFEDFENNEPF